MSDSVRGFGALLTLMGATIVHSYAFVLAYQSYLILRISADEELIMFLGGTACWGLGYLLRMIADRMDPQVDQELPNT